MLECVTRRIEGRFNMRLAFDETAESRYFEIESAAQVGASISADCLDVMNAFRQQLTERVAALYEDDIADVWHVSPCGVMPGQSDQFAFWIYTRSPDLINHHVFNELCGLTAECAFPTVVAVILSCGEHGMTTFVVDGADVKCWSNNEDMRQKTAEIFHCCPDVKM